MQRRKAHEDEEREQVNATRWLAHAAACLWLLCSVGQAGPAGQGDDAHATAPEAPGGIAQKTCPVMVGTPIDPKVFSDYGGKRVYFCCASCKATFDAAPAKYLSRLPQFAMAESPAERTHGFAWGRLAKPLGITTLALLLLTAGAGRFRRLKPRLLLKWHKRLAVATLIAALCHAALVLLFH